MNLQEFDVLRTLRKEPFISQRLLSETCGHSLGVVNRSLKQLMKDGYIDERANITEKAKAEIREKTPRNAIILAAGYGMRMVPINFTTPKALLEVNGERLIERMINQLNAAGVKEIIVVVGFMKESFEYLIDEYGVELVVNNEYAGKNNLHSLALVADRICNTYIIPCDIWCDNNPFSSTELYSWYMVSDLIDEESSVRVNRKMDLVTVPKKEAGNAMVGISYILETEAAIVREKLISLDSDNLHAGDFWEETLMQKDRMIVRAKVVRSTDVVEIDTYEQLRDLDSGSNHLKSDAIYTIADTLGCKVTDITGIRVLKKGMTNRSFLFSAKGSKYIMRIPGEGTEQLINRKQEVAVFKAISGLGLCDDPVYINAENGYKITRYLDGVRVCNAKNENDLKVCMDKLRSFHEMNLKVGHDFDIFGQIDLYESLWEGTDSVYRDYHKTKENVLSLRAFVEGMEKRWCLTHIDAVPDNFLFYTPEDASGEQLQLTDWEYSGMQDPHVDIAMFCIYSLYNKKQCDNLIDIYFDGGCDDMTRTKIYCYIAMCGLLWSNWCEYKRKLGIEFGEYALRQYRYAKDYYRIAKKMMEQSDGSTE